MEATTYLFQVSYDGRSRLLIVSAPNRKAVEAVEAVLDQDGHVSPTCTVLASFPGCGSPVSWPGVDEIPYHEFMVQMVEPDRILQDVRAAGAFTESMETMASDHVRPGISDRFPTLRRLLKKKVVTAPAPAPPVQPVTTPRQKPAEAAVPAPAGPDPATILQSGLLNLGFKKPEVQRFVDGLGSRVRNGDIPALIREGIEALNGRRGS